MMDVIYQCATITIVAMSSETSDSGIPGVSLRNPRLKHWCEAIDRKQLAAIPPLIEQELEKATYMTRGWTLQEMSLSRRWLYFTKDQAVFTCGSSRYYEAVDESLDPANCLSSWDNSKGEEINLDVSLDPFAHTLGLETSDGMFPLSSSRSHRKKPRKHGYSA